MKDLFWHITVNHEDAFEGECFDSLMNKIVENYAFEHSYPQITDVICFDSNGHPKKEATRTELNTITTLVEDDIDDWLERANEELNGQKAIESEFKASIALS